MPIRNGAEELSRLQGVSVLLAEDNVTNQLVATQMLENLGAVVDVAADGAIALERLEKTDYDVFLVDIEMPRVSGLDVIRHVRRAKEPLASAPVIALTAYAMQEHRDKIKEAGADGLIPKPIISIEQFGRDILRIMDDSAKRRGGEAPAPAVEDLPQIDESIFDSLAQSIGQDAMTELLEKIAIDLENVRAQIRDAHDAGDLESMRTASHVLISVAGAVGGVKLQTQAETLNGLAHQGDVSLVDARALSAISDLDEVLIFVRSKIEAAAA